MFGQLISQGAYNKWHSETFDWGTLEKALYVGRTTRVDGDEDEEDMEEDEEGEFEEDDEEEEDEDEDEEDEDDDDFE